MTPVPAPPVGGAGLELRQIVRRFGARTVVDGVDLTVPPGRLVGLLGPNGAGKTTVFRVTVGLLRPDRGRVVFQGQDVTHLPVHQRARRGLGYLPQGPSIFRGMTVRDNLDAALELRGTAAEERETRVELLLDELGLRPVAEQRGASLSGGERRRTEIARALCVDPAVLILDEPFAAIDPRMAAELGGLLQGLRDQGLGLLVTDHGARQLLPLCDEVVVILDGVVVARGAPEAVVDDPTVRDRYLGASFAL